jgi:hypothetical protein
MLNCFSTGVSSPSSFVVKAELVKAIVHGEKQACDETG